MTSTIKASLATIREKLAVKRLDSRRLFAVYDGAYAWIGDRADLNAADARALRAIHSCGTRPDRATADERELCEVADYDAICSRVPCIAASHGGAGIVRYYELPEGWQLGYLGPIAPL